MCAQPVYVHLVDASVQVYTSETLPVFIIGTSTFFPIVEPGLLGELLLLNSDTAWQGLWNLSCSKLARDPPRECHMAVRIPSLYSH